MAIGADDSYLLSRAFTYLEDKEGRLQIGDILKPETQAAFRPVPEQGPGANFGLTHSAIWLRVRKSRHSPGAWRNPAILPAVAQPSGCCRRSGAEGSCCGCAASQFHPIIASAAIIRKANAQLSGLIVGGRSMLPPNAPGSRSAQIPGIGGTGCVGASASVS